MTTISRHWRQNALLGVVDVDMHPAFDMNQLEALTARTALTLDPFMWR